MADFDPLTATIPDIQKAYSSGSLTVVSVVEAYLSQIEAQNDYLRAIISLPPKPLLLKRARELDDERKKSGPRGPLHGIPVIVKDNIATHPDLGVPETTAGSYALVESRVWKNAPAVEKLVKAGAIMLGKANLSEFAWFKGNGITSGWSALGGQTQSPYVKGGVDPNDSFSGHSNPGGSSSGSAVAIAAGLSTVAIGTETDGSIIFPGTRAALYCLKPTIPIISQDGVIPISHLSDSIGPMAKSPHDVAYMLDAMVDPLMTTVPNDGYSSFLQGQWEGLRVGALKVEPWLLSSLVVKPVESATHQMIHDINAAYAKLAGLLGDSFHKDIDLVSAKAVGEDENGFDHFEKLTYNDFGPLLDEYLQGLEVSPVRSLKEVIEWNAAHAELELPKDHPQQDRLIKASNITAMTKQEYAESLNYIRRMSRAEGIDKALSEYNIDVIIGPGDSFMSTLAAAAGYPIATVPLTRLEFNGRPFGLCVMTKAHGEGQILKFMSAWEATFPKRDVPLLKGNL